jgi:hypothetical protein
MAAGEPEGRGTSDKFSDNYSAGHRSPGRRRWRTATNRLGCEPGGTARAEHNHSTRAPASYTPTRTYSIVVAGSLDPAANADAELPA